MTGSEKDLSWLGDVEKIISALGDLFIVVWDKSPALGSFVLVTAMLFPFYLVYALFIARKPEKTIDQRVDQARKSSKKRLKKDPGGK